MKFDDRAILRARELGTPLARLKELAPRLLKVLPDTIGGGAERLGAMRREVEDTASYARRCLLPRWEAGGEEVRGCRERPPRRLASTLTAMPTPKGRITALALLYQMKLYGARGGDLCLILEYSAVVATSRLPRAHAKRISCKPSLPLCRSRAGVLAGTGEQ